MLKDAIETFEKLKKYIFIIDRGNKGIIELKFINANFYHLLGLQYTNINMFIPDEITSKNSKYKYIKKNVKKFEGILKSEIADNDRLINRISTFSNIYDILQNVGTTLYNLKERVNGSQYDGDYGLVKIYENINCLLGLKVDYKEDKIEHCAPQSWMASEQINILIKYKKPIYMKEIKVLDIE